jgi:CRP-like cAMP-binding protein
MKLHKDQKVEMLSRVPLFSGCSKKELRQIAGIADEIDLRRGKVLTRQGAPGREFFVLLEGTVDVVRDRKQINTLAAGEFFGEMALVSNIPRTATVTATSPIRVLVLVDRDFRRLLKDDAAIAVKVLGTMAERMPPAETH